MLVKLTPQQVAKYWPTVKAGVAAALPPIALNEETMNHVLQKMLSAEMQCWISYRVEKERHIIDAILSTCLMHDDYSGTKSLLIYSLMTSRLVVESWEEGLATLRRYARSLGCHNLIAYTDDLRVERLAIREGGSVCKFVTVPLLNDLT